MTRSCIIHAYRTDNKGGGLLGFVRTAEISGFKSVLYQTCVMWCVDVISRLRVSGFACNSGKCLPHVFVCVGGRVCLRACVCVQVHFVWGKCLYLCMCMCMIACMNLRAKTVMTQARHRARNSEYICICI